MTNTAQEAALPNSLNAYQRASNATFTLGASNATFTLDAMHKSHASTKNMGGGGMGTTATYLQRICAGAEGEELRGLSGGW